MAAVEFLEFHRHVPDAQPGGQAAGAGIGQDPVVLAVADEDMLGNTVLVVDVERLPFSIPRAMHTPYRHDAFQPRYLVSESLDATIGEVQALTPDRLLAL